MSLSDWNVTGCDRVSGQRTHLSQIRETSQKAKNIEWRAANPGCGTDREAQYDEVIAFVATAIKEMAKTHGKPKEKIASGKTQDGHDYFINEYSATKTYSQWERVAYVQLPKAVAYIVLSSRDKASYQKDSGALEDVLKTFIYLEPKPDSEKH